MRKAASQNDVFRHPPPFANGHEYGKGGVLAVGHRTCARLPNAPRCGSLWLVRPSLWCLLHHVTSAFGHLIPPQQALLLPTVLHVSNFCSPVLFILGLILSSILPA